MKNKNRPVNDNWATPKALYDELNKEFSFDFDPCPLRYEPITPDTDGLSITWGLRNFINPPYSAALKQAFVKRALVESMKGALCVCVFCPSALRLSYFIKLFYRGLLKFVFSEAALSLKALTKKANELKARACSTLCSLFLILKTQKIVG